MTHEHAAVADAFFQHASKILPAGCILPPDHMKLMPYLVSINGTIAADLDMLVAVVKQVIIRSVMIAKELTKRQEI